MCVTGLTFKRLSHAVLSSVRMSRGAGVEMMH